MTKILVVDDEPAQARGLVRAVLLRRPDYSVLTAASGVEAIRVLEEQHIDLVITDLQMTEMDGFEFLAWLLGQRPHVLAFAMTAYASDEVQERLKALGSIECFTKPLDIDLLVARVSEGFSQSIRGHVHNVGLASFLQLVELEKKTCTLEVRSGADVGQLFVRKGELFDAQTEALTGEAAAVAILGWQDVSITIRSTCNAALRVIEKPAYYVVMEAMRVRDESVRPRPRAGESDPTVAARIGSSLPPLRSDFPNLFGSDRARPPLGAGQLSQQALELLHVPVGALALAVVELATGHARTIRALPELDLTEIVAGALSVLRQQQNTLRLSLGGEHGLEELATMTRSRGELIKPLPQGDAFALLVFDPAETNLVMARLELDLFVVEYCAA